MRIAYLFVFIVLPVVWSFQRPKLASCRSVSRLSYPLLPIKSFGNPVSNEKQVQILLSSENKDICVENRQDDTVIMFGSCIAMSLLFFMPMLVQAVDITVGSGSSIDVPLAVAAVDFQAILAKASSRALDGGTAGASAAAVQGNTPYPFPVTLYHTPNHSLSQSYDTLSSPPHHIPTTYYRRHPLSTIPILLISFTISPYLTHFCLCFCLASVIADVAANSHELSVSVRHQHISSTLRFV